MSLVKYCSSATTNFANYSQMKGGETSKNIKPEKSNATELRCHLGNTSVRDGNRKLYPVHPLFMMCEGYIPQASDNINAESSGGHSLRNFRVVDLLHTRLSWEAMGIAKGKLPCTMMIDQFRFMEMKTHP